jgi:RNA polymerase sigma factor (sigma-70 family)
MDFEKIENLALLSKEGDVSSKEALVKEFTPFILNLSKKSHVNGYEFEDLKSECFITLFKCLEVYDPQRHRFIAYAMNAIKNSIHTLIRNSVRREYKEGPKTLILDDSLEHVLFYNGDFIEEELYKNSLNSKLKAIIKDLTFQEQDLINYVFYKKYTVKRYASLRGMSYSRAYNMKVSVLNKLKSTLDKEEYYMYKN